MISSKTAHPPIADREEWKQARVALLDKEKELTRQRDRISAERRRLPMVKLDKTYEFDAPTGRKTLLDLFDGKRQLIVYHFMFDPEWEDGCMGCTGYVDSLGDLSLLSERDTAFTLISRAPLPKLEAYRAKRGWDRPWVSSADSDFNYDFHATLDDAKGPKEYNFRPLPDFSGEAHGHSVFFRLDDDVYHTYSCYARSTEGLSDSYGLLDITPYGRQEEFEDSPEGWPQRPTYG